MRVLGVDPGSRRWGVAVGDDVTGVTTPLKVLSCRDRVRAVRAIADTVAEHGAARVVIGLPTTADGAETAGCARSRALAVALQGLGIETALQAEHLSTDEARRRARSLGRRPGRPVDDLAAQVILDEYLEMLRAAAGHRC